ncbi:MAG TPA: hypothetical protein DEP84_25520, partial [Chloroflexi bacterium]|nr:hypothetical protein [Chloroflexota bacterium]
WRVGLSHPWPNIWVYHTPQFAPLTGRRPYATITRMLREAPLRFTLGRLGLRRPLLWLFNPTLGDQIGCWDEQLVIYHVVDEYSAYTQDAEVRTELIAKERELLTMADLVVVTSRSLLEARQKPRTNVVWVPNGVAAAAFSQAQPDPALASLKRPILGYVGAINPKIDLELLLAVAEGHADATLLFVGPLDTRVNLITWAQLLARPNVHYAGVRAAAAVPSAVAACDVGLLPYTRTRWTENINSLKLNEYLAAGLPVVGIDLEMLDDARELVYVAGDTEEFVQQIHRARTESDPARVDARQRHAASQDWGLRVEAISQYVEVALAARQSAAVRRSIEQAA